jgi:hypothetical protein
VFQWRLLDGGEKWGIENREGHSIAKQIVIITARYVGYIV